jgi:hypothetical protein
MIVPVPSQDHPAALLCLFQARIIPPHECACSKPGPAFQKQNVLVFFVFNDLM